MNNLKFNKCRQIEDSSGYVLLGVLVALAISLVITVGMLQSATGSASTRAVAEKNTKNFYQVERSINAVTAWLQSNSKNIVTAFNAANFSTNFDLGNPTAGTNTGTAFSVPTLIKMKGYNTSVQLTNSSYFGTSAFPVTRNIDTNALFDAAASFQNTDFGSGVNVRLLAVWALQTNGSYQPIFRVDAVTGGNTPEHGVHGINFIKSAFVSSPGGVGYYASDGDFQTGTSNNQCWSYQYSFNAITNLWVKGAARSNCLIMGKDDISIGSFIHGNVQTNKNNGIQIQNHGSISGTQCQGAGCVSYTLPNYPNWTTKCGGVPAVDITAGAATTIASGSTLATQCFRDITIPSNSSITFTNPDQPYYIRKLIPQNNSNSVIRFATIGAGQKYTLYVDNLANGSINGNQLVATNIAPNQLEINLTQDGSLLLNGTAVINGVIVGRENFTITVNGNFTFNGALRAGAVSVGGSAVLGYDEALGGTPAITDINFTLYKASQRYR